MATAPLNGIAAALASHGRYGDTELLHVNRAELEMLNKLSPGGLTTNPVTGQKEAFLPFLIPLLANAIGPSVAGAMGLSGMAATLTPAVLSGLGTWAATGDAEQGLMTGVLSGLTGGLLGGGEGAAAGAADAAAGAATDAGLEAATQSAVDAAAAETAAAAVAPDVSSWMTNANALNKLSDFSGLSTASAQPAVSDKLVNYLQSGAGAEEAAGNGIMGFIQDNPMQAMMMVAPLLGGAGQSGGFEDDLPPYRPATPRPRRVVPYNQQSTAGASDYGTSGDAPGDSIWRYGQEGGEHMWFDPPPGGGGDVILGEEDDGSGQSTIIVAGQPFTITSGGLGNAFMNGVRRKATGGPIVESPRPVPTMGNPKFPLELPRPQPPMPNPKVPLERPRPQPPMPNPKVPLERPRPQPPMPNPKFPRERPRPLAAGGSVMPAMAYRRGGSVKYCADGGAITYACADGGPVMGPGTGRSDSIPAVGPGGQPYLLSDGEFVISSDVVSALGAGSNRAGASALSDMMQRVRQQAFGNPNPPRPVNSKVMPA